MCLRARALAAARPGDGRSSWGGRVAVLTGAARRGAASVGSLLIAAVPSSPIESDGFPTSSWCGARRRRLLAGGVPRGRDVCRVVCFWGVVGAGYGGRPSDGSTGQSEASMRLLCVFRGVFVRSSFPSACGHSSRESVCALCLAHRLDYPRRHKSRCGVVISNLPADGRPTFSGHAG